jgi:hypothetical protein
LNPGRKEWWMLIARPWRAGARFVGEDLHVAGQDDQVGPALLDHLQQARLCLVLGGRRHGDVEEREAGRLSHRAQVLVVGDHRDEFGAEAARPPAEDQVVEAVAELGHQDEHPLRLVPGDLVGHGELVGHRAERRRQAVSVGVLGAGERGP